jgi:hypothetical protein
VKMEKQKNSLHIFVHANLYYAVMVVCITLFVFFMVQALRFHLADDLTYAMGFYFMGILWAVIAKSSYSRGKGHYHYHAHLPK